MSEIEDLYCEIDPEQLQCIIAIIIGSGIEIEDIELISEYCKELNINEAVP